MDTHTSQGCLRAPDEVRKQKRKELDARRSKCRIRIGSHLDQWCVLKKELGFSLHSQLAKFLLDSYSSSVAMLCTEQPNEDRPSGSFSVTGDTLQRLIILCHDHSQDCGFIPSLKIRTPLDSGRARALLWECLAGHTFSWSLSLSASQDDDPPTCPRYPNIENRTEIEVPPEQLSLSCSKKSVLRQSSRRLRRACASRHATEARAVNSRERTEATTAPQSTVDATNSSSVSMARLQEENQETITKVTPNGQTNNSDDDIHASSEASAVCGRGSRTTNGRNSLKRVTTRCQWTEYTPDSPGRKQRTEQTAEAAQSVPVVQEAETAGSPNAAETAITGDHAPCPEASPRDFSPFQSLCLEVEEEQAMLGCGVTNEGVQAQNASSFPGENSAEEVRQEEFRDHAETDEENTAFIGDFQDENSTDLSSSEWQHLRQSDEDLQQIVRKRIRKTAKVEIIQCDYEGCGKIFSNRQYLNHHKKYQHVNQYTFTCSEPSCGKSFNFKKHLKEHEKRHSDKRDFICEFCARAFRTSSNLVIHRRIHTGEKPLQCEICGVTCRQKASLNWHMKKHDADSFYLFSCDTCGKKFEKRDNVMAHKKKKHPDSSIPVEVHEVPATEGFLEPHCMTLLEAIVESSDGAASGATNKEP